MSDINDKGTPPGGDAGAPPAFDPVKAMKELTEQMQSQFGNLKAEMNRKIDSLKPPPPPAPPRKPITDLMYEDPEAAVREIAQTVKQSITEELGEKEYRKSVTQRIYSDYPELEDQNSPLSVRANEIFKTLSESEKNDPRALRAAVLEAAAELTLAPKSKRKSVAGANDDSFTLSGGGGGKGKQSRRKEAELSDETLEIAQMMGLNVNDPKVAESLKSRASRQYGKYGS